MAEEARVTLRLPAELHSALQAWADRERRSLNAQIVFLLERAVRTKPPQE